MKKKNIGIYAITFIIAGLMITSTSVGMTTNEKNEKAIVGIPIVQTCTEMVEKNYLNKEPLIQFSKENNNVLGVDQPIFSFVEFDSQNPSITSDGVGNALVFGEITEDITTTTLFGRWSTDNGASWVDYEEVSGWQFEDACEFPKLDHLKDKYAWGTITPGLEDGIIRYIELPDMTDPSASSPTSDGWSAWFVDWADNGISGFDSADVACYSDETNIPNPEFFGVVALTGDWDSDNQNTMIISWFTEGGGVRIVGFGIDNEMVCDRMSCAIDDTNGKLYIIAEYSDNIEGYEDGSYLLSKKISADEDWWKGSWSGYMFEGLLNPDITADDGKICIVGNVDNGGQNDIISYYSSTSGSMYSDFMVTDTPGDNEVFPSTSIVEGDAACSFIKNNNLYSTTLNGSSWDSPVQINDEDGTVVEQYSGMNMGGPLVVWTDDRVDPSAVYFDYAIESAVPLIEIKSISGGLGATAVITNTGTAEALDLECSMTVTGGILGLIDKEISETVDIAIDEEISISTGIILGLGAIEVTVTAGSASDSKTGTQLLVLTMIK